MRKNLILTSLAMMVAMSEQGYNHIPEKKVKKANIPTDLKEIKPNGVKEYFFKENGQFSNTGMFSEKLFFKCFALNDKNAKRKIDAFRKRHRGV